MIQLKLAAGFTAGLKTKAVLILSAAALLITAAVLPASAHAFTDVPSEHPFRDAIERLAAEGVTSGYDDNTFRPQNPTARVHFAKMIVLLLGLPVSEADSCPFPDVRVGGSSSLYPDNYVAVAATRQIVLGNGEGLFLPYEPVLRAQVVTMAVRALEALDPGVLQTPPDDYRASWGSFSRAHADKARIAEFNGLLVGLADDLPNGLADVNPWGSASRGEVAQILSNLMDLRTGQNEDGGGDGDGTGEPKPDPDEAHQIRLRDGCTDCHLPHLASEHGRYASTGTDFCTNCHSVLPQTRPISACEDCHQTGGTAPPPHSGDIYEAHLSNQAACVRSGCHSGALFQLHRGLTAGCGLCHSQTLLPQSADCLDCHAETEDGHLARHDMTNPEPKDCSGCHSPNLVTLHVAQGTAGEQSLTEGSATCQSCHATTAEPAVAEIVRTFAGDNPLNPECLDCHGSGSTLEWHGSQPGEQHTAVLGSGYVELFTQHDDPIFGDSFGVVVECATCHTSDAIAAHAGRCSTCHPSPVNSLSDWSGGCQEGDCHSVFHGDSVQAHWETDSDPAECTLCHDSGWNVPPSSCANCHALYAAGDTAAPITQTDAQATYVGPARISFSLREAGKVGVGTTFRRLDGGEATTGSKLLVSTPGTHDLEFWSVDQSGNLESPPKQVSFAIAADTTPPVTTSDARTSYYRPAYINLTATDNGSLGVKATYYRLNDGAVQTGTRVHVPQLEGTHPYTLEFWSEDWSGNLESSHTVTFTITGGSGTIRLVWGDSDSPDSEPPAGAYAYWFIKQGTWSGPVVASGSGEMPGWSGVDDVSVPVSPTPYFVDVWWYDPYWGFEDNTVFPDVSITAPGDLVRLSY